MANTGEKNMQPAYNSGASSASDIITPRLGAASIKNKQSQSFFTATTPQNMSWHWERETFSQDYLIRAVISLGDD